LGLFLLLQLSGERFMPNEVEVSPIFSTYKEAPLGAFSIITIIGRALSEAISRPKGVAYAERS
jgi:hypothetical protein